MYKVGIIADVGRGLGTEEFLRQLRENGMEATMLPYNLTDYSLIDPEFEGIAVNEVPINGAFLDLMPKLRVIIKCGVGMDSIDFEATKRRGIRVSNMPGVNKEAVAELALGLMISAGRCIVSNDRAIRAGEWPKPMATTLFGKTMGIVGTGNIGTTLATLAKGFRMKVIGFDPFENDGFRAAGGEYVSFEELVKQSDFISVHVPLVESTYHMFSKKEFEAMKENAILVTCARGNVVDEDALYEALTAGQIGGAGLDVFVQEPPAADSPLMKLDNLVLSSHVGGLSDGAALNYDYTAIELLKKLLDETKQ